jgi:hypothetical protein
MIIMAVLLLGKKCAGGAQNWKSCASPAASLFQVRAQAGRGAQVNMLDRRLGQIGVPVQ